MRSRRVISGPCIKTLDIKERVRARTGGFNGNTTVGVMQLNTPPVDAVPIPRITHVLHPIAGTAGYELHLASSLESVDAQTSLACSSHGSLAMESLITVDPADLTTVLCLVVGNIHRMNGIHAYLNKQRDTLFFTKSPKP